MVNIKRTKFAHVWPIDPKADGCPSQFPGWPENKKFALVLTHDVDTAHGQKNCFQLMQLERRLGFRSSFNFVPERYNVSEKLRNQLTHNGFEVGVHGLNHDGKLFRSASIFEERSKKINRYISRWNAKGFRAPAMHHNLDWIHLLNIEYDASTFDTDPFEPQPDGCATIYPFWVANGANHKGYIELPYTLPQDFTVFILMKDFNLSIWQRKLDWIVQHNAMALLNTHPDYMCFGNKHKRYEQYPAKLYQAFLEYIKNEYSDQYWQALPKDVAKYWKDTVAGKSAAANGALMQYTP
jgi:peptidoglycan/xylan/chitin deacetylase (PgdA/CDA1 family)